MFIYKIDNGTEENGEGFSAAGGGVYQPAFTINYMLPGFFLEGKRMEAFVSQPVNYDLISG